jgi:hypothetical protein
MAAPPGAGGAAAAAAAAAATPSLLPPYVLPQPRAATAPSKTGASLMMRAGEFGPSVAPGTAVAAAVHATTGMHRKAGQGEWGRRHTEVLLRLGATSVTSPERPGSVGDGGGAPGRGSRNGGRGAIGGGLRGSASASALPSAPPRGVSPRDASVPQQQSMKAGSGWILRPQR